MISAVSFAPWCCGLCLCLLLCASSEGKFMVVQTYIAVTPSDPDFFQKIKIKSWNQNFRKLSFRDGNTSPLPVSLLSGWECPCKSQPVWAPTPPFKASLPTHTCRSSVRAGRAAGRCVWQTVPPQLALSVSTLIAIGPEERLRSRPFMRGSTCHLTWITFTTSPECLPLAGWPGRTSWSPGSSAACWSVTEPSGRRAW